MSLSFLAPLFLAGLAALAIPVVLHLRRQSQRREREFPSLMFLQDIPFRSEHRRRLRHRFLLALRLLALALLVAAFARPFLDGEATATAGDLGPREVVVLVDRSWSMGYGERWAEATAAVGDVTASLGARDRVSVVLFDEGATAPIRSSPEIDRASRVVADAAPGDRATNFAPAVRLARSLLEASQLPRGEVVLVSDFQDGGWSGAQDVALPRGTSFTPVPVGGSEEGWSNVSVQTVELQRTRAGGADAVRPVARVVRRGPDEGPTSTVAVLEVEGEERERVDVSFEGETAEVTFGPVPLTPEPRRAEVRISEDRLPPDDRYRLVLSPGERISVLVAEAGDARENASLYLRRALEISRDPPVSVEVTGASIPSDLAERFDVLVLHDRPLPSGAAGTVLREFLEEGGGLLWAPGEGPGGGEGPELGVEAGEVRDHDRGGAVRLGSLDRRHPVFEPFREAGTGNFSSARFFRSRALEAADSARILARFGDGAPALVETAVGSGRMLVWGSTLHTFWTDLPVQPVFLPFVQRAAVHLADRDRSVPFYRVGDVLALTATDAEDGDETTSAPDGSWVAVLTPEGERLERSALEGPLLLDEAGFYELLEEEEAEAGVPVAVNVDPAEGDLTRRDVDEVTALVTPAAVAGDEGEAGEPSVAAGVRPEDRERHQGFWRFLLAAAFVFLVGETIVSNRLNPRRARA